jgi:RNA polymerase sigma factor (sigma-70 family)
MQHENELQHLVVPELAQRCVQETKLYLKQKDHDPKYCFELFRRAIRNNDQNALEVVIVQYEPLVARWVNKWMEKYPNPPSFHDETQDFIAQAFERFCISFTPDKFDKSNSLAAVLRYLKMCAYGAFTDAWRKVHRIQLESLEEESRAREQEISESEPTPEELRQRKEFWQMIKKKAKDPKEYLVVYASFYLNYSPREILAEYPGEFKDIKEIYQHKANFLERLERDDDIKGFFRGQ